jgi:hypothetical protein
MDQFTAVAAARAETLQKKIEQQLDQASIRYVFAPIFDMIVQPLATTIQKGHITPISEQGQPVGEVYLLTLVKEGEALDPGAYNLRDGVGEIPINPAPIVDALLSQYGAQGAAQIKCLFNLGVGEFLRYRLNEVIFGDGQYDTADDYLKRFAYVRAEAEKEGAMRPLLDRVLQELRASVEVAFAWARAKAEESNLLLKSGDLKKFSPFERRLFKFADVTAVDDAMNQMAVNQSALANSLPTVMTEFKEAVIASKPDYSELGAAIGAAMKDGVREGVKEALSAAQNQTASPPKEETKPAPAKGGNKTS